MPTDLNAAIGDQLHAVALPPVASPITTDLVEAIGWDIAKELAAYVERMYPDAVKAGGGGMLLSLRNHVFNDFKMWSEKTDPAQIEALLAHRKRSRRKLRGMVKAARTITPDTPWDEVKLAIDGHVTAPDMGDEHGVF